MNNNIMSYTIKDKVKHQIRLYRFLKKHLTNARRTYIEEAKRNIAVLDGLSEQEKKRLFGDFCKDYDKYRTKFSEWYYGFLFPAISEEKKYEYLTQRDMSVIVNKYHLLYPEQRITTGNKEVFLKEYAPFVQRKWMYVDSSVSVESVQDFIDNFDVIAKPTNLCSGKGVYKIKCGEGNAQQLLQGKLPLLLEECVQGVKELAEFHPASLNTIRLTTISNGKDVKVFGACFRTGNNNSVFDNADAGGYFATIDIDRGIINSDGVTISGLHAVVHPASGKAFRGTQIPRWDEVVSLCKQAALFRKSYIIAWDIAITTKGIEIIEGNSVPSVNGFQLPLHTGNRKRLYTLLDELHLPYKDAVCLTKLISGDLHMKEKIKALLKKLIPHKMKNLMD